MTKNKSVFSGWFQINIVNNFKIFRKPIKINKEWFDKLYSKHYSSEFTSKYNENLFVDQDKNSGKQLLNEILFSEEYFKQLFREIIALEGLTTKFLRQYETFTALVDFEDIELNKKSKQFLQLEKLKNTCQNFLNEDSKLKGLGNFGAVSIPLEVELFDLEAFEIIENFKYNELDDYSEEYIFLKKEPSDRYAIEAIFKTLSENILQLRNVNALLLEKKNSKIKIIHGNAGMGKSNFSAFIYNELLKKDKPAILINGKSFNGNPDDFESILMDNLLVPNNYKLDEILAKLNTYGEQNKCRLPIIIDGLNETSFANDGFSKIWFKSLDSFIENLKLYPHLYFVATLRTSYISRIWSDNSIPYNQIQLNVFSGYKLKELINKYFNEFRINTDPVTDADVFFFGTPLYLDLYCKMLNGEKVETVDPLLGFEGFEQVFTNYLNSLAEKTRIKLGLITKEDVLNGIDRVSKEMINELEAFVPKREFFEKMEGKNVDRIHETIGFEILEEYLIYLDENFENKDVIIHTQQEIGGYLLANKLILDYGSVDDVVKSFFFEDYILGKSGKYHQLKDDILKFLIAKSDASSLLFVNHIEQDVIKKFTTLNLLRTKPTEQSQKLTSMLLEIKYTPKEVLTLLNDSFFTFYDHESNINFLFIKDVLLKLNNYDLDFSWTYFIYNNYTDFNEFLDYFLIKQEELDGNYDDVLVVEVAIWLSETSIRDLRDKSTRFLIGYFERFPELLLVKLVEYSRTPRIYIKERLALICYGVCLRLQNNSTFITTHLGGLAEMLYNFQFSAKPSSPTYNYIIIDSYKHIIDLALLKGVFELSDENRERLSNYTFNKDDWFDISQKDIKAVPIAHNWDLSGDPDPLRGDFVHYTIPRLDHLDHENREKHTANIYKEILRLGYISDNQTLSGRELSFYSGTSLIGNTTKIDRLGKKYSWMAYFNYAGYLLSQSELGIWATIDSSGKKFYKRLSDTEIEPSYSSFEPFSKRFINNNFFKKRTIDKGDWIKETNYDCLESLYEKDGFTLLSAFVDQKLDEKYKTRSWVQAKSYLVDKAQILDHIESIESKNFDWKLDLSQGGSVSNTYFGELYWADSVPNSFKESHNLPTDKIQIKKRKITLQDVLSSDKLTRKDIGGEIQEEFNEPIYFEYQNSLIDFIWETDSKQIPTLRCDIPAIEIGKHLNLTVDSSSTKILDSNLELCFKEFLTEYDLNSENFHYFRTDLLEEYLIETNQVLMYQLKQHTYDQATDSHHEHFRGMQFVFSPLNRQ